MPAPTTACATEAVSSLSPIVLPAWLTNQRGPRGAVAAECAHPPQRAHRRNRGELVMACLPVPISAISEAPSAAR